MTSVKGSNRLRGRSPIASITDSAVLKRSSRGTIVPRLKSRRRAGRGSVGRLLSTAIARPASLTPIHVPPLMGSPGHTPAARPKRWTVGGSATGRARCSSRLQATRNPAAVGTTDTVHIVRTLKRLRCRGSPGWRARIRIAAERRCPSLRATRRAWHSDGSCAARRKPARAQGSSRRGSPAHAGEFVSRASAAWSWRGRLSAPTHDRHGRSPRSRRVDLFPRRSREVWNRYQTSPSETPDTSARA